MKRDPWKGLEELVADLGEFDRGMVAKVAPEALRETGREIVDQAKRDTPRDTGKSADSIEMSEVEIDGQLASVDIGSDWFVVPFLEFGTSRRPALRMIGRAVEERSPELRARLVAAMNRHAEASGL